MSWGVSSSNNDEILKIDYKKNSIIYRVNTHIKHCEGYRMRFDDERGEASTNWEWGTELKRRNIFYSPIICLHSISSFNYTISLPNTALVTTHTHMFLIRCGFISSAAAIMIECCCCYIHMRWMMTQQTVDSFKRTNDCLWGRMRESMLIHSSRIICLLPLLST